MNRLKELLKKKELETITEDEKKELQSLEAEKELMDKIKNTVSTTVDEKLKANEKLTQVNTTSSNSYYDMVKGLMSNEQYKRFETLNDEKQRSKYINNVAIAQYIKALKNNNQTVIKDLSEGTDSAGGYLVPAPLSNKIYEVVKAQGVARREMTVVGMNSLTLDLSTLATKPTVYWVSESSQITGSDIAFGRKTLSAEKLAGITAMSNELIDDANIGIVDYVVEKFSEAFIEEEDKAFFNTCTATNVTGILQDSGTNVITMGSGNTSFADISYDDIVDVIYSLGAKQRKNAKFAFSKDILAHIMKLTDSQNNPIWSRPIEGQPARILGYPIVENDQMPTTSDDAVSTEFLAFGNFKKYLIGDRKQVTASILKEATVGSTNLAEKDASGVRIVERISGIAPNPTEFTTLQTAAS